MITYDAFQTIEIRAGRIIDVVKVEGADRLLRLSVDFGEASLRQIVSGIAAHFPDLTALAGVTCAFVTNLEPKTIRGLSSDGMILAAGVPGEAFSLLKISSVVAPGTRIK
jgi:methionyl-tRNA synthetase